MNIAIIGSGNVGGALAAGLKKKHSVVLGVRDPNNHKGMEKSDLKDIPVLQVGEAVQNSEVIILSVPASTVESVSQSLGDTSGKVIIDTMNTVPPGDSTPSTANEVIKITKNPDVVKCFNTVGANILQNPRFGNEALELYMSGDSSRGKEIARTLCLDLGFSDCIDIGGNDRFLLMEQFAFFWINLAMFQKKGRDIGFKLVRK